MKPSFIARAAAWFLDILILMIGAVVMILTFVSMEYILRIFIPDDSLRFPIKSHADSCLDYCSDSTLVILFHS